MSADRYVPARPRGRRASHASALTPGILVVTAGRIAVRALGIGLAAAAVTLAMAGRSGVAPDSGLLPQLSIRGLAAAAILCAAWGFQDRPRLGRLATHRAWAGAALVVAFAHAGWLAATMPARSWTHPGTLLATLALDVVLVAAPALVGARAGRPEIRTTDAGAAAV